MGCGAYDNTDCDDNSWTYEDLDSDGFGNPNVFSACGVIDDTDCDDNNNAIGSGIMNIYFADQDGDGFGTWWPNYYACSQPVGYVDNADDCDDFSIMYEDLDGDGFGNPLVQVGCGAYDNTDCDDNSWTYEDNDGDGFGNPNAYAACGVIDGTDCDDNNSGVGSGIMTIYYPDNDGDGFGDPWSPFYACSQPFGYIIDNSDCDDWAIMYLDADSDGFGVPGSSVACGAYNDLDCDDALWTYEDVDGDGFGDPNTLAPCGVLDNTDCDDNNASIGGGTMIAYYNDFDGDGYGSADWGVYYSCYPVWGLVDNSDDCDDFDYFVNPGVSEIPSNGIDDDCDGTIDIIAGVNQMIPAVFNIYPNPTKGQLFIQAINQTVDSLEVKIYDGNGRIVNCNSFLSGDLDLIELDMSDMPRGIYFIQISSATANSNYKLVVN